MQSVAIIFLLTVPLWAAVLIWADSSRPHLDAAWRQMGSCPDGSRYLKLQNFQKTCEEILVKRTSKRKTVYGFGDIAI